MKNLSDQDLIKKLSDLLALEYFSEEDSAELVKVQDEMDSRKSIRYIKQSRELKPRTFAKFAEVNLVVLDKETVQPFKKYTFGYALDSTKPFDGDNMLVAFEKLLLQDIRVGSVVCVKTAKVIPVLDGLFKASIQDAFSFEPKKDKPYSAKEIIRKAFAAEVLELKPDVAQELVKKNIIKIDLDKHFGVQLNKQLVFKAGQRFGENGVVYGVVYPVDEVDTDGDSATADEVLKACWRFMEDYQNINFMHKNVITSREVSIVECATALAPVPELGIKKGDWYMAVKVRDPELKKMIESGEITGFSMEGTALPEGN